MKLMIVRHGDPDYEHDSLTETGWREAGLTAELLSKIEIAAFFTSPLGRAQATAGCTLEKMRRTATTLEWLREFSPRVARTDRNDSYTVAWDWLPQDWTAEPRYYNLDTWADTDAMRSAHVKEEYRWVCDNFDALLADHGYVRENNYYRVENANSDTLVFFCHFGVECVLLSRLLHVSPMILWHGFCAAPSSITTVNTEERRKGIASFRISEFGSTAHLYAAGIAPSFSARFCECFENKEERHD